MTTAVDTTAVPAPRKPQTNRIGLTVEAYEGSVSTLCKGCGHDRITSSIINALFEMGVEPHRVAKLSGIGCSSKSTNYFLNSAHGFNSVHGRMAPIATGAALANRGMVNIGVSGDGDTASIGIGHFMHMIRRNVPMVYIIENNGCYGLTKGQFSATADKGSVKKGGGINEMPAIDCCSLAIELGCGFVARSFSGDGKQVTTLLKAAMGHKGTAVIDILSPCVTFNNHEGSTKSIAFARDKKDPLHDLDFIPYFEDITIEMSEGDVRTVKMHDGSAITIKKLDHQYDPGNQEQAMALLERGRREMLFFTGLLYYNGENDPIQDNLKMVDTPLASLPESVLRPGEAVFEEIMEQFK